MTRLLGHFKQLVEFTARNSIAFDRRREYCCQITHVQQFPAVQFTLSVDIAEGRADDQVDHQRVGARRPEF
ncbi:hypothetical protein [Streptomyces sp. M92]|uniref:hypothetical protein n=1 Tax=Streptomyces sp. M92 TaxID=2944250 RepID=UPI003FA7003F